MSTKVFSVYHDFPFFFPEELDEIINAHEKVFFIKAILFWKKEKHPTNI
ncbi:hypothetical protein [Chryseobacterium sp. 3008163]|nr:hypothetical protein [Chryseobacterium sp. 3008163]